MREDQNTGVYIKVDGKVSFSLHLYNYSRQNITTQMTVLNKPVILSNILAMCSGFSYIKGPHKILCLNNCLKITCFCIVTNRLEGEIEDKEIL